MSGPTIWRTGVLLAALCAPLPVDAQPHSQVGTRVPAPDSIGLGGSVFGVMVPLVAADLIRRTGIAAFA